MPRHVIKYILLYTSSVLKDIYSYRHRLQRVTHKCMKGQTLSLSNNGSRHCKYPEKTYIFVEFANQRSISSKMFMLMSMNFELFWLNHNFQAFTILSAQTSIFREVISK